MKIRALYPFVVLACAQVFAVTIAAQKKRIPSPPTPAVESNAKSWQQFISSDGRFSVLMPGKPEKSGEVLKTGVGSRPSFSISLKTGMAEYIVSYTDFPVAFDDQAALKAAYDFGRDETLKSSKFTLVADRDISVEGHVGRHITAAGNNQLSNHRIIAVGKRLYQMVIATRDYRKLPPARIKFFESTINKFLDSLKLLDAPKANDSDVATSATRTGTVDLGKIENSVYTNDYFSFEISLPQSWTPVERETTDAALEVSKEKVKGSDSATNQGIDQSIARTVVLFTVTKFPLRTPNVTQAMLQCGAERLVDKRLTGRTYIEKNRDFLLGSPLQYKLLRDVYPMTFGGLSFFAMDMQQTAGNITVNQKYYATVRNGYALFFVSNYFNEADNVTLEKTLRSAKFKFVVKTP